MYPKVPNNIKRPKKNNGKKRPLRRFNRFRKYIPGIVYGKYDFTVRSKREICRSGNKCFRLLIDGLICDSLN